MNRAAHCHNFLEQTASLRFESRWEDVRELLTTNGVSPEQVVLFSCDHAGGSDMSLWFALPDGAIVNSIVREDESTGLYSSIIEWRTVESGDDEEMSLASRIASDPELSLAFSSTVADYFRFRALL